MCCTCSMITQPSLLLARLFCQVEPTAGTALGNQLPPKSFAIAEPSLGGHNDMIT